MLFELVQSAVLLVVDALATLTHNRIFNPKCLVPARHGGHGDSKFDSVYVNQGLRWGTDFFDLPKSSMNGLPAAKSRQAQAG
jgi:hypothetical protein